MQSSRIRNRVLGFAAVLLAVMGLTSSSAWAQGYAGTVVYPITLPSGFLLANPSIDSQASAGGLTVGSAIGAAGNAMVWSGPAGASTNLNPSGFTSSTANGTNGTQIVGSGSGTPTSGNTQALLWSSSASSTASIFRIRPPPQWIHNFRRVRHQWHATGGRWFRNRNRQQPARASLDRHGSVGCRPQSHCPWWHHQSSIAYATNGSQRAGFGFGAGTSNNIHAMLWSGTAASAIDLNPTLLSGVTQSQIEGLSSAQQVGIGYGSGTGNNHHAMLWTGTAASAVDLNPTNLTGIDSSAAY